MEVKNTMKKMRARSIKAIISLIAIILTAFTALTGCKGIGDNMATGYKDSGDVAHRRTDGGDGRR